MWRDAWFRASLINNIVFTVSYVAVLIVLSFMVAYVLNEYVVGKKFVQLGLYLPYIVNIVAISAVWLALFSNNGPILNLLRKIGMEIRLFCVRPSLGPSRHCIDLYLAEPGIYSDPVSFRYDQCAKRSV